MYPPLEFGWESRALRVAMPLGQWERFDRLAGCFPSTTLARSHGAAIAYLLHRDERAVARWLDWDQEKHVRLLQLCPRRTG